MDQKTLWITAGGIAGIAVLYYLMHSGNETGTAAVTGYTGTADPSYLTYNYPDHKGDAIGLALSYVKPVPQSPIPSNTDSLTRPCPCSSGCGANGIYQQALNGILAAFTASTNALANAYQNAMLDTVPDYVRQYINNDAGYIASQRALKAIGTTWGVGNNMPFDAKTLTQPPGYQVKQIGVA